MESPETHLLNIDKLAPILMLMMLVGQKNNVQNGNTSTFPCQKEGHKIYEKKIIKKLSFRKQRRCLSEDSRTSRVSVGSLMRLCSTPHFTSPFVVVPSRSLTNRARFSSLVVLSAYPGRDDFSRERIQLLERYPSRMVDKLGTQGGPTTLLVLT